MNEVLDLSKSERKRDTSFHLNQLHFYSSSAVKSSDANVYCTEYLVMNPKDSSFQ